MASPSPAWRNSISPFGVYDLGEENHTFVLGRIEPVCLEPKDEGTLTGTVMPFDQNEFAPAGNAAAISMDNTGYAFVPAACASGMSCGLVLALHGCLQYYGAIGPAFVDDAGINQWADTNRIIVLYPQTIPTAITNGEGCWDWWGYLNDPNYAQKSGPQMQALYSMVSRAAGLQ